MMSTIEEVVERFHARQRAYREKFAALNKTGKWSAADIEWYKRERALLETLKEFFADASAVQP